MRIRNSILLAAMALAVAVGLAAAPAHAETVVRYGISMADIPLTTGQPDRGAGAYQFTGLHDLRSAGRLGNGRVGPARQTGARASPPNGRSTTTTRPNGASRCARASNSMTAATSTPTR